MRIFVKHMESSTSKRYSTFSRLLRKGLSRSLIARNKMNPSIASLWIRIEFDCKKNVPANTIAYYLIIHDRVIEYSVVQCSTQDYVFEG